MYPIWAKAVRTRPSREGKYVSVTVTFEASSKAQLDAIYQAFKRQRSRSYESLVRRIGTPADINSPTGFAALY